MKFWTLATTALLATTFSGFARAQAQPQGDKTKPEVQSDEPDMETPGPWMGRLRVSDLIPLNHSAPFGNFQGYAVHVSNKILFEGDISYFFTKSFAVEFSANAPVAQNVSVTGFGQIGSVTLLVPMVVAQYHFQIPHSPVKPYVGLGVAWTHVQSQNFSQGGGGLSMTKDTLGHVLQLGVDVAVSSGFYVNLDLKHFESIPNLRNTTSILTDVNMSPNVFSIGVGYRF